MFRKTKIRLVSLYSLVFFLIVSTLGAGLYIFMNRYTYTSIDDKLRNRENTFLENHEKPVEENERESERKVSFLYWGEKDQFIKSDPENALFQKDLTFVKPSKLKNNVQTLTIEGHYYRIFVVKENHQKRIGDKIITNVQLVYNIDPEAAMLKKLLELICFGSVGALVLSIFVGFFLATRALVPIQKSWEKQSRFVADASHELRTPLSVIQTHLELLFRHPANTIEQESITIYKSLSEVKRVNKLVEDLLTLARSDSDEKLIEPHWFSFDELLKTIIEQFEPIAEINEITMEEKIEGNLQFMGDKSRLHQLFVILVDNAIKYTMPGGKVIISSMRTGHWVQISIKDTGAGIPEGDLPFVFDRFYRGNKSRTRAEGGTGLGLSIAKWIVEAHRGHISVESKLNRGTEFIIKLPMKENIK